MTPSDAPHVPHYPAEARSSPSAGGERLSAALRARAEEISRAWLEELDRYLSVPRRQVFPDDALLEDVHVVVRWIVTPGSGRIPDDVMAVLRALVDLREGQGRFVGDLYREFHLLSRILHDVLAEEAERAGASPADVAREAGRLSRGVLTAVGVATDLFDEHQRAEADRALESFGAAVRHELRNPLGAAQGAAQLLEEHGAELSAERFQRMLKTLARSIGQALGMLESVTSLSRDEPPEDVERWEPLREVLSDVVERARSQDGARVELSSGLPSVLVDGDRVEIVVHNLVENAVKYRDPRRGEGRVAVGAERDEEAGGWWIRVEDDGVGIHPEEQERIFRRFYRASDEGVDGTGLGLSIAREAARQMGGRLEVQSEPGDGSVFSLFVPDARTRRSG